jgi:hypothetical protein
MENPTNAGQQDIIDAIMAGTDAAMVIEIDDPAEQTFTWQRHYHERYDWTRHGRAARRSRLRHDQRAHLLLWLPNARRHAAQARRDVRDSCRHTRLSRSSQMPITPGVRYVDGTFEAYWTRPDGRLLPCSSARPRWRSGARLSRKPPTRTTWRSCSKRASTALKRRIHQRAVKRCACDQEPRCAHSDQRYGLAACRFPGAAYQIVKSDAYSLATLSVDIFANDKVSAVLAKLDGQLDKTNASATRTGKGIGDGIASGTQKAAGGALALQQAQARLEAQQGNLAGAADRLRNALSQVGTTTVQSVNAQRQLLAVEAQLASGTSALGGHFKSLEAAVTASGGGFKDLQGNLSSIGGAIGGLPGQLLSVGTGIGAITTAIGVGVGVVQSFGEAFKFKAELDATTASINAQLKGVRDTGAVYASAAQFAAKFKLTQEETTSAIQASIGVMRASKAPVEDILSVLARLQVLSPEQSLSEAALAVKALASGDTTSLVGRFEVSRDKANEMKAAIQGGADAVGVLSGFLDQSGIGMDALASRTVGASGAMKDLAIAQEQLKLAQAEFAQGPGLTILEGQIRVTSGATRVLTGDFTAMGASLQTTGVEFAASAAGALAYATALSNGSTVAQAQIAANQAATASVQALTQAQTDGGGGAFQWAGAEQAAADAALQSAAAAAQDTLEQNRLAVAHQLGAGATDAAATAAQQQTQSLVDQIAKTQQSALEGQRLAEIQATIAGLGGAVAGGLTSAGNAAAQLASQYHIAVGEALKLISAQAALAGASKVPMAGISEDRLTRDTVADRAKVKSDQALESNRKLLQSIAAVDRANSKPAKAAKGGGGGGAGTTKLSDQQKLNNSLLSSQESFQSKSESAEQAHLDKLASINADFQSKMKKAQESFAQSQLDGRAGFYDTLGSIEDQGLRQALAAEYEAAFAEADKIATEKGADVGQKFLEAKQAAIQAQGQRASEIAEATKSGDKDKAAYLAGVDKLYRDAEARKLEAIKNGTDSAASERDAAIAAEDESYTAAQEKIGTAADQAAARKVLAAERAGQAVDAEGLKVDALASKYDALAASGERAGVAPATTGTTTTPTDTTTPAAAPTKADDIAAAIASLKAGLSAIESAVKGGADKITGAVKSIPRSVT